MKTIKTTIIYQLIAVIFITGLASCSDFLEKEPSSGLTPSMLYSSVDAAEPVVNGLAVSFRKGKAGRDGFTFTLLGLDETKQGIVQMTDAGQAGLDRYNGSLNSASSQISAMWTKRWPAVNTAAEAIRGLEILTENETRESVLIKARILRANACFIRALSMFEMTMYWGEIPVIEVTDINNPERDMSRKPLDVVWKQIHDDLVYASENLDEGVQALETRATRGAALAMLGKLYLYAPEESGFRDYNKAIEYFERIKSMYNLEAKYITLFDEYGKCEYNSKESIYEINFRCNSTGPNYWQWDMGSRTLANLGESCYIGGYDVALPTEYAYNMKADGGIWEDGDQRRDVSMRFDFTYRGQTFETPSWGADELDPHIKKWEDRRLDKFTTPALAEEATSGRSMYWSGKNYMYLRYSDILLCYAECLNETGKTDEAMGVVNQVRARAWGGTLPTDKEWKGLSKEQFRTEIMDERIRELCFEGWRRMDLIRTGKFVDLIKQRNQWAKESGTIQSFNMRWPIPDIELTNNPYMDPAKDQNPGY